MQSYSDDDHQRICQTFGCDDALLQVICEAARHITVSLGHCAYPTGKDEMTTLLLQGRAHEIAYSRSGGQIVLHELGPGELYGALLSLADARDQQEIIAISNLRGAQFSDVTLLRLMESYSVVALAITRQLVAQLQLMRQRMAETVLLSAVGRICAELSRRSKASADGMVRPVPVFTEFAVIAQTTRETVSRTISQLEKRGIIAREDGGLRIVAQHRLDEMIY